MSIRNGNVINLVSRKRGYWDDRERVATLSYFHEELLEYYDAVLYTDVDEIIVPEPNLGMSLKDYIISSNKQWINPIGLNVLHDRLREGTLDLTKPLFSQRAYAQFDQLYCKPAISRVPMRWTVGLHFSARAPCYATDLYLFHLRAMDYDISKARIRNLNSVPLSEESVRNNYGFYWRVPEQEYLNLFFSTPEAEFAKARSVMDFSAELSRISEGPFIGPIVRLPTRFRNAVELTTADALVSKTAPVTSDLNVGRLYLNAVSRMTRDTPPSRNARCPCGSGKRFKHCHGFFAQLPPVPG